MKNQELTKLARDPSDTRPWMPGELAAAMRCSRAVIDASLKDGSIPYVRLQRRIFIPDRAARALLNGEKAA